MEIPKIMPRWSRTDKIGVVSVIVAILIPLLLARNGQTSIIPSSDNDSNKILQLSALVKLVEGKVTSLDKRELLDSLSGAKVEGTGYFTNLDQIQTGQYLVLMYDTIATTSSGWSRGTLLGCNFSQEWYPLLKILHEDEKMNFSGEIKHGSDRLMLENCKLIQP